MKFNILSLVFIFYSCQNSVSIAQSKNYSSYHQEAFDYCKQNNFDTGYYILIDLSIHSGKNRFFVYDFKDKKVLLQNLVTHGSCDQYQENPSKWQKAKFDNRIDSHCSMKGKFKIGKRDYSAWGIHVKYWLHGLETTNKEAVQRVVVLHSWSEVDNQEIYPNVSPLSWGCPAVSNEFMKLIDAKLKQSKKPVLLWIIG
ncbi:murein L,D-transpeptidase catalytic domain-containing protein [Flavobacterium croceum]|uniref:murein L,D-transpeptidase catalytic domain-containing protein n=1 Tax=Flavobacterium croceum TaxID=370975 RepID=UPI0024A8820D|nr:murein L,D-transpeptidase catalytic domain family protein [Flavobacterium croceum]